MLAVGLGGPGPIGNRWSRRRRTTVQTDANDILSTAGPGPSMLPCSFIFAWTPDPALGLLCTAARRPPHTASIAVNEPAWTLSRRMVSRDPRGCVGPEQTVRTTSSTREQLALGA